MDVLYSILTLSLITYTCYYLTSSIKKQKQEKIKRIRIDNTKNIYISLNDEGDELVKKLIANKKEINNIDNESLEENFIRVDNFYYYFLEALNNEKLLNKKIKIYLFIEDIINEDYHPYYFQDPNKLISFLENK